MQQTSSPLRARTFTCMGTVISLTVPAGSVSGRQADADELEAATAVVERLFTELDAVFSLYRPGSEANAMARGELMLADASPVMRARYAEAAEWRRLTDGAFTPERPDGVADLSGIIKARAMHEAGTSLPALGLTDWCVNGGGDVLVSGSPEPGSRRPWLAGIVDPSDRRTLLTAYPLGGIEMGGTGLGIMGPDGAGQHRALATSGTAERGHHIWSAGTAEMHFRQVSVAAEDIVTADVLATAIMAGGRRTLDLATARWGVGVLAVGNDGGLLATPGFRTG